MDVLSSSPLTEGMVESEHLETSFSSLKHYHNSVDKIKVSSVLTLFELVEGE